MIQVFPKWQTTVNPIVRALCGGLCGGCAGIFEALAHFGLPKHSTMDHAWLLWLCGCPPLVPALASDALNESEIGHRFCNPCSSFVWFPNSVDNMWDDVIQGPGSNFQLLPVLMNQMNQSVGMTQIPEALSDCWELYYKWFFILITQIPRSLSEGWKSEYTSINWYLRSPKTCQNAGKI